MGDTAAIRARLGLDTTDWRANTQSAAADVARLTPELAKAKAEVRAVEEAMRVSGGATEDVKQAYKALQQVVREKTADLRRATQAEKEYAAAQNATAAAIAKAASANTKAPDESARYEAYWRKKEEEERSRRAADAIASARTPQHSTPDESARYEEHWKRLEAEQKREEERTRSDHAHAAIRASNEAKDAERIANAVRVTRGGGGTGIYSRSFTKPVRVSLPEKEDESHEEGGGGSNRLRNQELGHVARSIFDQVMAGQNPLRALEQEGPRILQAFGSSLGGIAKAIGAGGVAALGVAAAAAAAAAAVVKAHAANVERFNEVDNFGRPRASLGGTTVEAEMAHAQSMAEPISKLQAESDKASWSQVAAAVFRTIRPAQEFGANVNNWIAGKLGLGGIVNFRNWLPDGESTTDQALHNAQGMQTVDVNRAATRHAKDNKLAQDTFSHGADSTADKRLDEEFQRRSDEISKFVTEQNNPNINRTALLDALTAEIDLRKKITKLANENAEARRQDANSQIFISHPGMSGIDKPFVLPPNMTGVHSILSAQDNYAAAQARLENVRGAGGDTRGAEDEVLRAKAAVEDATIDRSLMTPMEQNAADRAQLRRDQARERIDHPGTHDADREGSSIHDASGPDGSGIPEAGTGNGALESPDNMHSAQLDDAALRAQADKDFDGLSYPTPSGPFAGAYTIRHGDQAALDNYGTALDASEAADAVRAMRDIYNNPLSQEFGLPLTPPTAEAINPALASNDSSTAIDFSPVVDAINSLGTTIVDATTGTA